MRFNRNLEPRRRGTILVVALVVLTFLLLLGAALARAVVIFRQQARMDERRQQALLLADSAIQRATRAAFTINGYQGETWNVPAEALGNGSAGVVAIRVEKPAESSTQRRIFVEAIYPEQGTPRFVYRRELRIDLPAPSEAPAAATSS